MGWTRAELCGPIKVTGGSLMKLRLYHFVLIFFLTACAKNSSDSNNNLNALNTETLRISAFNVKWFGIGGTMWNRPENEFRQNFMRQFVEQELKTSDVITFVEVVETETLKEVLKGLLECVSYDGSWSRHQHIMTCYKPSKYRVEKYDEDYIIPEVDLGSGGLRPALQAKLCHAQGECFLQIIGLHLAAGSKSEKRMRQIEKLRDELSKHNDQLPSVILGDMNSYRKGRNGLKKDDIDYFEEILNQSPYRFSSITRGISTYGYGSYGRDYDHIIVTHNIQVSEVFAYPACGENTDLSKTFIPYSSFRKYFSDHCPVTALLKVPTRTSQKL